MLGPWLSKEFC